MSKARYLKEILKSSLGKTVLELGQEIKKEKEAAAQLWLTVIRGQSKQTHTLRQQKNKVAILETLRSQKKFIENTK